MVKAMTHLMFQGEAERAIELYSSLFEDFRVEEIARYGEGEQVPAGRLKLARISFAGHALLVFDSPPVHKFSFTPAMSLYVDFDTRDALDAAFERLSEEGTVMMALDDYGFSERFGWIADRFGLSWQLNLASQGE